MAPIGQTGMQLPHATHLPWSICITASAAFGPVHGGPQGFRIVKKLFEIFVVSTTLTDVLSSAARKSSQPRPGRRGLPVPPLGRLQQADRAGRIEDSAR